jgi:hypothetical protein
MINFRTFNLQISFGKVFDELIGMSEIKWASSVQSVAGPEVNEQSILFFAELLN